MVLQGPSYWNWLKNAFDLSLKQCFPMLGPAGVEIQVRWYTVALPGDHGCGSATQTLMIDPT